VERGDRAGSAQQPPEVRSLLGERQARGALGAAVSLDDPAERRRAFEDAALLAVEMLSHEESAK
jgi:hypothetical protein